MKTLLCAAAGLAALLAAGQANAQSDWTGPYIGAVAGWSSQAEADDETIQFDTNLDGTFGDTVRTGAGANAFSPGFCNGSTSSPTPAGGCDEMDDGFEFGARAGYDWQFGSFVVGVVGEAVRTDVQDSVTAFSTTPAAYTMTRELDGLVAARLRGGFAFGNTLAYATGGYAMGKIDHRFSTTNTANVFTQRESDEDYADGWQLGGGLEHQITPDVSLGLEYLYTSLQDDGARVRASGGPVNGPFTATNVAGTDFQRTNEDFEVHSVRVAATYRF